MTYSLSHLSDQVLLRDLTALVAQDRTTTAALLAHLAEVDERKLYLPAGYPSLCQYCVTELRMSEDVACDRIHAARTARQFPALFPALADGRLHLSAVLMLARHFTPDNVDELIAAASHKSKAQIAQLRAERFPRPDVPTRVEPLASCPPGTVGLSVPERIQPPRPKVTPLSVGHYGLQATIDQETRDDMRYAHSLFSRQIPPGDVPQLLKRAFQALVREGEKKRFAATSRPRRCKSAPAGSRYVPKDVRRAVWERDGGQCTFIGNTGKRCPAHERLEFDHVDEVARGGTATVGGIRLRCRAHNQYTAELRFGKGFMDSKREEARRARAERAAVEAKASAVLQPPEDDLVLCLQGLKFSADEVRQGVAHCRSIPDAPIEERVHAALQFLRPPHRRSA